MSLFNTKKPKPKRNSFLQSLGTVWECSKPIGPVKLASKLWVPPYLRLQSLGFPCCCDDSYCDENCDGISGSAQYEVILNNIVDDSCSDCEVFNDTFILSYKNTISGPDPDVFPWCHYQYIFGELHCGPDPDAVSLELHPTYINVLVWNLVPMWWIMWRKTYEIIPYNCNFNSLIVDHLVNVGGECSTSSSCTVSSA